VLGLEDLRKIGLLHQFGIEVARRGERTVITSKRIGFGARGELEALFKEESNERKKKKKSRKRKKERKKGLSLLRS
jgi:hypothetical protein